MHLLLFCQTTDDAYISCLSDADKKKKATVKGKCKLHIYNRNKHFAVHNFLTNLQHANKILT